MDQTAKTCRSKLTKQLMAMYQSPLPRASIRRIVFWYDEEGAFRDFASSLKLNGVTVFHLDNSNSFAAKLYMEAENTTGDLLLYSPMPKPPARENWLRDAELYSSVFKADEISQIMFELSLDPLLRASVEKHLTFFSEKGFCDKFSSFPVPKSPNDVESSVISILCGLGRPDFEESVKALLSEYALGASEALSKLHEYGAWDTFWDMAHDILGYDFQEKSIEKLALCLLCSHMAKTLENKLPRDWQAYVSSKPASVVLIDSFLFESGNARKLSEKAASLLGFDRYSQRWVLGDVVDCGSLEKFDQLVAKLVMERLIDGSGEYGLYRKALRRRRVLPFYNLCAGMNLALDEACVCLEQLSLKPQLSNFKLAVACRRFFGLCERLAPKELIEISAVREKVETGCLQAGIPVKFPQEPPFHGHKQLVIVSEGLKVSALNALAAKSSRPSPKALPSQMDPPHRPKAELRLDASQLKDVGPSELAKGLDEFSVVEISHRFQSGDELLELIGSLGFLEAEILLCGASETANAPSAAKGMPNAQEDNPELRFEPLPAKRQKVSITLANLARKLTGADASLVFYQTEPASASRIPIRLKCFFEDEGGRLLSNANIIIGDIESSNPADRVMRLRFTLSKEKGDCFLKLMDMDSGEEIEKIGFELNAYSGMHPF